MLRSMTAFARHEQTSAWGAITWELRSVNHRYLEASIRLPEMLRSLETPARERIAAVLSRGKVEGTLKLQTASAAPAITLNEPMVERLLAVAGELEHRMGPGTGLALIDVLRWPGVIHEPEPDLVAIQQAILDGLDAALALEQREPRARVAADAVQQRGATPASPCFHCVVRHAPGFERTE